MLRIQAAIMFVVVSCVTQSSFAEKATVRNGYIACEDQSALVLALKYVKEKKEVTTGDLKFRRCSRTDSMSGLPVEIIEKREGCVHLLLRAEKQGERDFEFWTQDQALDRSKPKKSGAKSSRK